MTSAARNDKGQRIVSCITCRGTGYSRWWPTPVVCYMCHGAGGFLVEEE